MIDENERIIMIDTETTNDIDYPFCYDVGYHIFDLAGNVYEEGSYVNSDIFLDKELMASAYYAEKMPDYWKDIWAKKRTMLTWREIKQKLYEAIKRNNVRIISAHNARVDYRSLNLTQRYITTSRWRWALPWGMEWWDTLKMAREIFKADENYRPWCEERGYITLTNQAKLTAEVIYRYITGDENFTEAHTGLEDVKIETEIFKYCLAKNPDIDGRLWKPKDELITA
jgi:DNA polymerase III epsilon subunit-like protein